MSWKARLVAAQVKDARVWRDEVAPLLVSVASSALKANEGDWDGIDSWLDDIETEVAGIRKTIAERDLAMSGTGEG